MSKHVAAVGFIHLILGLVSSVLGVLLMAFGLGGGLLGTLFGDTDSRIGFGLAAVLGAGLGSFVLAGGLLGLLTAYGLLARRGFGRVLGIISSTLWVLSLSWTSLIGIYGLWVLLSKEGAKEFSGPR